MRNPELMNNRHLETAEDLLRKAKQKGASAGDIVLVESESSDVQVRMGAVDKLSNARERKLGIRLFFGKRAAVSSTADFSESSLDELVSTTCDLAQATSDDPHAGLPENGNSQGQAPLKRDLDLWDPEMMKLPMEERIGLAQRTEAAALAADSRITNSEGGDLGLYARQITYANTNSFSGQYRTSSASLSVMPIASLNGTMQRDYWYTTKRKLAQLESPESIGREAAHRTVRRLGGRRLSTLSCPVVFDPETAGELLGALSSAVSGYSLYKGASFLVDKLGESIAAPNLTVIDNGLLPSGLGTRPFDAEGIPSLSTKKEAP